jgi:hypothetical protein
VIGASIGAELMRVNDLPGTGIGASETALFCTSLVQLTPDQSILASVYEDSSHTIDN